MELLLNYLIKSGICLLVLYLFYYGLLRKLPRFSFNRFYLLLAAPVALTIPFLRWPASLSTEAVVAQGLQAVQLPEVIVTAPGQQADAQVLFLSSTSFLYILLGIYLLGMGILIIRLLRQLSGIRSLAATATPTLTQETGVTILETPAHTPTFAFLSYVFISCQSQLSEAERKQVLDHELAHVQLKHTLDILYFEILTALLWFNPVVWLLKNELRDVHEYQADAQVVATHQPNQYSTLLAKEVLYSSGIPVGSYFKEPQVLKRLQMLHRLNKRSSWLRPILAVPLLGCLAFMFSSHQLYTTTKAAVSPALPISVAENSQEPEMEESKKEISFSDVAAAPSKPTPEAGKKFDNKASEPGAMQEKVVAEILEERPFTYVEEMPHFKGGELELQKLIASNITYPDAAVKTGKEGLVFLSFTVTKEGTLTDYKVVKGLSEEIDAEALRVLKLTENNWNPGRQNGKVVPVRFTLPIRFALNK